MKLVGVIALIVVLAASLLFLWSRSAPPPPGPSPVPPAPAAAEADGASAPASAEDSLSTPETTPSLNREAAPATPVVDAPAAAGPRCRIHGRLVDETGTPLPGIQVVVDSVGEPWAEGVRLPKTNLRGREREALAAVTDSAGLFSMEESLPTSDWITLNIRPDEFHGLLGRNFGPAGGRNEPRLVAGDNDLGDLALATTGAVEGIVRGSDGSSIPKAQVMLDDFYPGGLSVGTRTEDDGRFLLGHVPAGTFRIGVSAEGWLSAQSEPVEVRLRQKSRGVDFVLEPAPRISGVVVDESGKPVPKVRINAWPRSSGQGAFVTSGEDGSFTAHLPQNESYRFDVEHAGFEHYGGFGSELVLPGTTDFRIVLKKGTSMTFVVVDEESGVPIDRYGIDVQVVEGDGWTRSEDTSPLQLREHAAGECRLDVPKGKAVVRVEAADHALAAADVAEDSPATGRQTLRLARGSSLSGRVLRLGAAAAGVSATLERCTVKIDASLPDEPSDERWFSDNYRFDLSPFVGRTREVVSGADGRFVFSSLAAGTYTLTLREKASAPWSRESLSVGSKGPVDLGDIPLEAGSSIRGRLLLPPGRSPLGWQVVLDGSEETWPTDTREASADGRFLFEGLKPGVHSIGAHPPGGMGAGKLREVDLPAGGSIEVDIDVSALQPGELRVRVTRAGQPMPDLIVSVNCEHPEGGGHQIGDPTDKSGRSSGKVSPCPTLWLEASSPAGLQLGKAKDPVAIPPDGLVEAEISISAGEVVLVFPEGFLVPEKGQGHVTFQAPGTDTRAFMTTTFSTPDVPFHGDTIEWKGRTVDLGLVASGEYEVMVYVSRIVPRDLGGTIHNVAEPTSSFQGRIQVEQARRADCVLQPAEDR